MSPSGAPLGGLLLVLGLAVLPGPGLHAVPWAATSTQSSGGLTGATYPALFGSGVPSGTGGVTFTTSAVVGLGGEAAVHVTYTHPGRLPAAVTGTGTVASYDGPTTPSHRLDRCGAAGAAGCDSPVALAPAQPVTTPLAFDLGVLAPGETRHLRLTFVGLPGETVSDAVLRTTVTPTAHDRTAG